MDAKKAYGAAQKLVKSTASGFDHAQRTGDNTFSIFFKDGSKIDLTIPIPQNGVSIVDTVDNKDGTFKCKLSDGTFTAAVQIPKQEIEISKEKRNALEQKPDGLYVPESNDELEEDLTATVAIGSVTTGKKYAKGTSLEKILRDMLIKEEAPAVVLNLNPTKTLYDVVSETLTTIVLSAVVTKKTYPPTKVTFYVDDVAVNEKPITDGGTFSYTHTFSPATKANHTFKVVVTDGKLSGNASKNIKFVAKSYYGILADDIGTPTEAQIKGLANNVLKDTNGLTYSGITTDFGKVCYAYPKEFGALASIKDTVNNYNYTDSFSKATVSVDGIEYLVYTQTEPSAADNVKLVFA